MKKKSLITGFFIVWILISGFFGIIVSMFINGGFPFKWNGSYIFTKDTLIFFTGFFLIGTSIFIFILIKQKMIGYKSTIERTEKASSTLYGDSEFMTIKEINEKYPLVNFAEPNEKTQGIILNSTLKKDDLYCNVVYGKHSLVVGTSGSGKSAFFLEPTLQFFGNTTTMPSLIVTDPKGELFNNCAKVLKHKGYDVKVLNLNDPKKSHRYNPLSLIWKTYHKYIDSSDTTFLDETDSLITELSTALCPITDGKGGWEQGGQNIIQGLVWAMLEDSVDSRLDMTEDKFLIYTVMSLLNQGNDLLKDFVLERPKTANSIMKLRKYVDSKAEETSDSYLSTATNRLNAFIGSGLSELMRRTDIDISTVQDRPTAIFVIVPDENTARHPLATLFISQVYQQLIWLARENEKTTGTQRLKRDFYFLLDEFGNFPKMPCIEQMLSIGRSRKIWTMISVQSLAQLHKIYGKEVTSNLMNNLHLQIFLGAAEVETLDYFSKLFGNKTVRKSSVQIASADIKGELQGSTSLEKAALITPEELSKVQPGNAVIFCFQNKPAKTKFIPLFDKRLIAKEIFRTVEDYGKLEIDFDPLKESAFDKDKVFYDLIERSNRYNADNIPLPPEDDELSDEIINDDSMASTAVQNPCTCAPILDIIKNLID